MVRVRLNQDGVRFKKYMNDLHKKFAKKITHRLVTETINAEGQITGRSTSDNTFWADLQYGMNLDKRLLEAGWIDAGDAVLYVAAAEAQSSLIVPDVSIIIEGNSSGTYDSWTVISRLSVDEVQDVECAYVFRCQKRTQETIA